jgi:hypothetical protein
MFQFDMPGPLDSYQEMTEEDMMSAAIQASLSEMHIAKGEVNQSQQIPTKIESSQRAASPDASKP